MDWVSFDEIKKTVSLQMVIDHYGIPLRRVGREHAPRQMPLADPQLEREQREFHGHPHQRRGRRLGMPVAILHQIPRSRRRQRPRFRRRDGTVFRSRRGDQIANLVSRSGRGRTRTRGTVARNLTRKFPRARNRSRNSFQRKKWWSGGERIAISRSLRTSEN